MGFRKDIRTFEHQSIIGRRGVQDFRCMITDEQSYAIHCEKKEAVESWISLFTVGEKFNAGAFSKKTSDFTVKASPGRSESNYCKNNFLHTNPYKHSDPAN